MIASCWTGVSGHGLFTSSGGDSGAVRGTAGSGECVLTPKNLVRVSVDDRFDAIRTFRGMTVRDPMSWVASVSDRRVALPVRGLVVRRSWWWSVVEAPERTVEEPVRARACSWLGPWRGGRAVGGADVDRNLVTAE